MTPALQVLVYPALDLELSEPSFERLADGYGLTRSDMQFFWAPASRPRKTPILHPYASPLRADTLRDGAPAMILSSIHSSTRASCMASGFGPRACLARTVRDDGMVHGFMSYLGRVDAARIAVAECGTALKDAIATQLRRRDAG